MEARGLFFLSLVLSEITRFWWIVLAATMIAFFIEGKIIKRKIPWGVAVLAVLLISASVHKLIGLANYEYYQFMFQQLPAKWIPFRYMVSVSLRGIGIAIGLGLLFRHELARKMAIVLCFFTIILLPWKHPYQVFQNVAERTAGYFETQADPLPGFVFYCTLDIVFCLAMIFCLTRPKIKEFFRK
jgi:hypothetical protein